MRTGWTSILFASVVVACSSTGTTTPEASDAATPTPTPTSTSTPPSDAGADSATDASPKPPGTDAGDAGDAGAPTYCQFRTTKCKETQARCDAERKCFAALRSGAGASIEACAVARNQCNSGDDCVAAEATKYVNVPTVKTYHDACVAKRAACGAGFPISADACDSLGLFPDATLAAFEACLAMSCADAPQCFLDEFAKSGCDG